MEDCEALGPDHIPVATTSRALLKFWSQYKKPKGVESVGPTEPTTPSILATTAAAAAPADVPVVVTVDSQSVAAASAAPTPAREPTSAVAEKFPYDIVGPELLEKTDLELQALDLDDMDKVCARAKAHPECENYCQAIRELLGETGNKEGDWVFGDDFYDLVHFVGFLRASGKDEFLIEPSTTSDEMASPVPGNTKPYNGPSIDSVVPMEVASPSVPGSQPVQPPPALPVVPVEKLASMKFSAAVVQEFQALCVDQVKVAKRQELIKQLEWWALDAKINRCKEHPSCVGYEAYITTLCHPRCGPYTFGTDDRVSEVALFEFWIQAELNLHYNTKGTNLAVDQECPFVVPAPAPAEALSPPPPPAETPMKALLSVLTRATIVDLQGTPTVPSPVPPASGAEQPVVPKAQAVPPVEVPVEPKASPTPSAKSSV